MLSGRDRQSGVRGRTSCCGSGQPAPKRVAEAEGTTTDVVPKPHLTHKVGSRNLRVKGSNSSSTQGKKLQEFREKDLFPAGTSGPPVPRMRRDTTLDGAVSVLLSHALRYSTLLPAGWRIPEPSLTSAREPTADGHGVFQHKPDLLR